MKKLALSLVILVVVVGVLIWWLAGRFGAEQIITLPKGQQYRFAGVTYGTNDTPPSLLINAMDLLPQRWADRIAKRAGNRVTYLQLIPGYSPQMFVWFRPVSTSVSANLVIANIIGTLTDDRGIEAGQASATANFTGLGWTCVVFHDVLPRRSRVIRCNLYDLNAYFQIANGARPPPFGTVVFDNPVGGNFPQWTAEPLPVMKQPGEFTARLDQVATGRPISAVSPVLADGKPGMPFESVSSGAGLYTFFDVLLGSARGPAEAWVTEDAEISDATGNLLKGQGRILGLGDWNMRAGSLVAYAGSGSSPITSSGEYRMAIPGALWPDESAWRLKLWVKRKSGFPPGDLVTFSNVPVPFVVGRSSTPRLTQTVSGVDVTLAEFDNSQLSGTAAIFSGASATGQVGLEFFNAPDDVAVDLVKVSFDTGEQLVPVANSWQKGSMLTTIGFMPVKARTADITVAVQKTRTVEFLVKPPGR